MGNLDFGNGFVSESSKPVPEPILIYHQWDFEALIWSWGNLQVTDHLSMIENYIPSGL